MAARVASTLANRVAVVTGSTSGIGLATARRLAAHGADVVLNGFGSAAEIDAARAGVEADFGVRTAYDAADLMDADGAAELVSRAERDMGRVDILVNNAGIQHVAPVHEFPVDRWDAIIALNLSAVFHTTRAALPGMYDRGFGRIINVASVHGLVASKHKSAYVAAKVSTRLPPRARARDVGPRSMLTPRATLSRAQHGVVGLTKATALEAAGTGVTANAICPGWVLTPLVQAQVDARAEQEGLSNSEAAEALLKEKQPSLEFVQPDALGDLAAFLASDSASGMTGASLPVDGGWTSQ